MSHGHHGGGGFHHGGHHHHHHHHHRHGGEGRIVFPLFGLPLLGAFWRPRYYYGPRYRRSGCSIFALLFGILILFFFMHFPWLLIPIAILAVLGVMSLLKSLTGKSAGPGSNYQPYNQPYQANQPYQQGYSAPPPPGAGYQPYPPQSGWGQYDMPQAQYPQNMPPMP